MAPIFVRQFRKKIAKPTFPMTKNLFDEAMQQSIMARVQQLSPSTQRQWGKMTVEQVVCHMADPFRDLLHLRPSKPAVPRLFQPLMRMMVLTEKNWKPGTPTLQVYRQGEGGGGTSPTEFERDKATLLNLIAEFCAKESGFAFAPHPGLGKLKSEQIGYFMWKHTDHHLRQFGL